MCLEAQSNMQRVKAGNEIIAWKIIIGDMKKGYLSPYRYTRLPVNQWLTSRLKFFLTWEGFHAYVHEQHAVAVASWTGGKVLPVLMRGHVRYGMIPGCMKEAIVATQMYLLTPKQAEELKAVKNIGKENEIVRIMQKELVEV